MFSLYREFVNTLNQFLGIRQVGSLVDCQPATIGKKAKNFQHRPRKCRNIYRNGKNWWEILKNRKNMRKNCNNKNEKTGKKTRNFSK